MKCVLWISQISFIGTNCVTGSGWKLHRSHPAYLLMKIRRRKRSFLLLFLLYCLTTHCIQLFQWKFLLSLLFDRPRWCCSNNDSWTQRKRDSEPPGEEHHCDDVYNYWDTKPAEVRQPDLRGVCLHLLHCADDHLTGMAGLLLHPAIPLRKCQGQESGELVVLRVLVSKKIISVGFNFK